MNKILVLIICALFLQFAGRAQINLVRNPSFEQHTACPDNYDEAKYSMYWSSIDTAWNPPDWAHDLGGVPDLCHVCATYSGVTVPWATRYTHYPRTGDAMMQVITFFNQGDTSINARDYLQQRLSHILTAGHRYNVFFFVTLAQASNFAQNNVGAYFDNGTIDTTHHPGWVQSQYTPQILDTNVINDTLNWVKIEDTFTATGTEMFMTIGNFSKEVNTHLLTLKAYTSLAASWYLVDDVSVIDCANEPHAGNDTLIHPSDSAWLGPHEDLLPYTWYVLGSMTPIDSGGGIWVKPAVTTTYVLKQVLCGRTSYDTVRVRVWPDTVTMVASSFPSNRGVTCYPNPANNAVTVEGVKGCEIVFYDVIGRQVASYLAMTSKEVIDIAVLPKGVYLVHVMDRVTGERVVVNVAKE